MAHDRLEQLKHASEPVEILYVPPTQEAQTPALEPPQAVLCWPAGHPVHAVQLCVPAEVLYVPPGQPKHEPSWKSRHPDLYCPAGQLPQAWI